MKKLFGVMILAGLPVACGSTLPSAPDAVHNETAGDDASASSLAKSPRFAPACNLDEAYAFDAISLTVIEKTKGGVRIRAEAVVDGSDIVSPCFAPKWSVSPANRGVALIAERDPQVVTLVAPVGKYEVTAEVNPPSRRAVKASIAIVLD